MTQTTDEPGGHPDPLWSDDTAETQGDRTKSTSTSASASMTPQEQRQALVRMALLVVGGLAVAAWKGVLATVLVVLSVLLMIMLHELGHYLTAKWGGMKVTEFFVGFGPKLWSIRRGETEYGVKAFPVGGYVKIIGMHNLDRIEDPTDEPRTYRQKPFPQRLAVAVAGSAMHVLIAFVLFVVMDTAVGIPASSLRIAQISPLVTGRSPAQDAGFQKGDRIVSVDGRRVTSWAQIPPYIQAHPGDDVRFVVERGGRTMELTARPVDLSTITVDGKPASPKPRGFIGIGPDVEMAKRGPISGVALAARQLVGGDFGKDDDQAAPGLIDNAKALGGVFSPAGVSSYWKTLTGEPQPDRPDGGTRFLSPVGLTRVASQAADTGLFSVLVLLIAINLFVALFNMLPLLPLDGGHVAIAVYEAVRTRLQRGRRYYADVAKLLPLTYAVVLLILFLGVSALYLDIAHPLNIR
jgi:membrane-associated protease RseP (regulator of RpoE activity)